MCRERLIHGITVAVTVLAGVVAIGGCGSSGSSSASGADPASIVPAGSVAYFSAVVRPSGSLKAGAISAAREISHLTDPFGALMNTIQASANAQGSGFDYASDIAPWLGPQVGVFVDPSSGASLSGASETPFAVIADSTNSSKASAFIAKMLRQNANGEATVSHSYRGTAYKTAGSSGRDAGAIVKGFAVYGSLAGVREVIGTAGGGATLAGSSAYLRSGGAAGADGSLAGGYVDVASLLHLISSTGIGGLDALALGEAAPHSFAATFSATGTSLALDMLSSSSSAKAGNGQGAPQALAALPGDAWLGLGLGDLHADVTRELSQFGAVENPSGAGPVTANSLFSLLDSQLHGLRIERDILPWLGQAGLFVTGSSLGNVGGALVVDSRNPKASKAAVPRIRAALAAVHGITVSSAAIPGADAALRFRLPGSPFDVYIVDGNGRFAVALGAQAAAQALRPSSTLAGSTLYRTGGQELGAGLRPTFLVSVPALARLVLPSVHGVTVAAASKYLQAFTVLAVGEQRSGTRETTRFVAGLR